MSPHGFGAAPVRSGKRLRVNPILCDAHGMCAELLPEQIVLDEWGYPVVGDAELPEELLRLAKEAVEACPTRALLLERMAHRPDGNALIDRLAQHYDANQGSPL